MPPPSLELADILRQHGAAYRHAHALPWHQWRLMRAIENCRTAALGGAVEWCDHCQNTRIVYRSCRDRNCPKCQGLARERWIQQETQKVMTVSAEEFIRRFLLHALPPGFPRIRYYGLMANCHCQVEALPPTAGRSADRPAAPSHRLPGFLCGPHRQEPKALTRSAASEPWSASKFWDPARLRWPSAWIPHERCPPL